MTLALPQTLTAQRKPSGKTPLSGNPISVSHERAIVSAIKSRLKRSGEPTLTPFQPEATLRVLEGLLDPAPLPLARGGASGGPQARGQIPGFFRLLATRIDRLVLRYPPAQSHVGPKILGTVVGEPVAYPLAEAQLSDFQPLPTQFPAAPVSFGYARTLLYAHHVVEVMLLEPPEESGAPQASIGQDHGTNALKQRLDNG
jgi:hypothetical protein